MPQLLNLLTKDEQRLIKTYEYEKETTIFHEDDLCTSIGILLKGELNILSYSYQGKEIIYNIIKKDDVFGNNLIFSDNPFYRGNVITKDRCKIAFVSKENLIFILKNNENFLKEYLRIQSNFGKGLNARIKLLSLESSEDRLMYYLHMNNGEIHFKSITSLASYLGLARETLSRLISKLIKGNIIKNNSKTITLKNRQN